MTDKQIIIDGVDVSGCIHKKNDACMAITNFCGDFKHYCNDLNDCNYKNWKRKEQECDMWKNLTVDNGAVALKYQQQLDQLKAENDVLFKAIEEVNKINKRLESENKELKKCYKNNSALLDFEETNTTKLVNKVMKLEQILTEIKIFVMQAKHDYNLPKYLFDTILQKISEVENEKI